MQLQNQNKGAKLLAFLRDVASLRRRRKAAYGADDRELWFADIPGNVPECRSAFHSENPKEFQDSWLEVRKKRMPVRQPVPDPCKDWVRAKDLEQTDKEPELLPEITVLIEGSLPDLNLQSGENHLATEKVPELRRLVDHPEVQNLWLEYLVNYWDPWAKEMRRYQEVQRIYEDVDFMRRRLEEAEERYDLILAVGLLQWRDPTGTTVRRHLLTAPAEIHLDAGRGVLTVSAAATFDRFRIELDMLELHEQPQLRNVEQKLEELLEDLDIQAWDTQKVGEILRTIANCGPSGAQVDENSWRPAALVDESFRVVYAPALILRERRPTAYEELITHFVSSYDKEPLPGTTTPWERFISEGEPRGFSGSGPNVVSDGPNHLVEEIGRLFFPLPTNDEQREIADRLRVQPYLLVKGPPGTGKSHAIANLICHLLASGDRVLITAHAPKALAVLRELLPKDVRDLCVTSLGATRDDQRLLEESVRGILRRKNEWRGNAWAKEQIEKLENELRDIEGKRTQIERGLRECREAETHSHTLSGGYEGTAAQIARQLEKERGEYDWFFELPVSDTRCPLSPADIADVATCHARLTEEHQKELQLEIGEFALPSPEEFEEALVKLAAAEAGAQAARQQIPEGQETRLQAFRTVSGADLGKRRNFLRELEQHFVQASLLLGDKVVVQITRDLLAAHAEKWNRLAQNMAVLLESMKSASRRVGSAQIDCPSDIRFEQVLIDARRRLQHFEKGGYRGFGVLAPKVVRETRYIEERCRIDGREPRTMPLLEKLATFLELRKLVEQFSQSWPTAYVHGHLDPREAVNQASDLVQQLHRLLEFFGSKGPDVLNAIPIDEKVDLAEPEGRRSRLALIEAEVANRLVQQAQQPLETWLRPVRLLAKNSAHPCIQQFVRAIEGRDSALWKAAWDTRERLQDEKRFFRRYKDSVELLDNACPGLGPILIASQGKPEWRNRLLKLERAWAWSAARAWLGCVSDSDAYRRLGEERQRLQDKAEKRIGELASLRAWQAFFQRLGDQTEQNLVAWTRAVDRIGKGTGKYAYRQRRTARQYLIECIPKIPAWIMPLHKLWDSARPEPGLFDTVIIDEASQAGIESLLLLLLAKRIIVVGDEKQNSPEAVGVPEDDIERLAREHLSQFHFRGEFRPDTSLFDHAERAFGSRISLREHFRCVPEIIRFSNELCYTDAPLIPLRPPLQDRLAPLRTTFVPEGFCEGEGQRIINRLEADKLVEQIQRCLEDELFEGKTMGVIVLQGHAQAELIEKALAEKLEPRIREERRLRCGVPATFQGDQRDVIFLSLVIAPNHRFRALNRLPDIRRFNVAMSRARDQVWLFHSIQAHDLSREDLRWKLLSFFDDSHQQVPEEFYEQLERLESEAKRFPRQRGEQPDPYESWFEVDVALELLRRKYRVCPQYDVAGYRIDLVLEGRLAVECDGDAWHGPERYERDMVRQRQLERAGFSFVRVRESEFYANRARSVRTIVEECGRLDIRPIDQHVAASPEITEQEGTILPTTINLEHELEVAEQREGITEGKGSPEEAPTAQFGPFTGYSDSCGFPDPREASPANVRVALRQIIEKDGPLSRESLYRLYNEGCAEVHRVGKAVRQALNRALGAMLRSEEIVQEDELRDGSPEGLVVRLTGTPRVRERPAGQRDLQEIPPSELLMLLGRIATSISESPQDLEMSCRTILDHYGFTRLTEARRKYLTKILKMYLQSRQVFNERMPRTEA
jgi:very-short-patch-repair endonuclease